MPELVLPPVIQQCPKTGRWLVGHKAWNKNKRVVHSGSKETQFKPGHVPKNTLYNGYISKRFHKKDNKTYLFIRIAPKKWMPYHRYVWEQHCGPIPSGYIIRFKDGNNENCTIENLCLISRLQHLQINHNREKASQSIKTTWKRTRIRHMLGLAPISKWGERMDKSIHV